MRLRPLIALLAVLALAAGPAAALAAPKPLPGEITTKAPWPPGWTLLRERLQAIGLPALSAEGLALHIHQHLDIWVNGRKIPVPAGIGIGVQPDGTATFISDLHTHDTSGVMHVESPTKQDFTLGQFFDVWGVRLSSTCIGGHCDVGKSRLRVWVNGKQVKGDPRAVVLKPHQEIAIVYGTDKQLPSRIPSSFAFENGL